MKNKLFTILSGLAVASLLLVSCYPQPLEKAEIDAQFAGNPANLPTLTITADNVTFESITFTTTSSNASGTILESGVMFFNDFLLTEFDNSIKADVPGTFTIAALADKTYYVQSYVITVDGTSVSEAIKVKTPEAPVFEDTYLFGLYDVTDYALATGNVDWEYEALISKVEGTYNKITIEGLWGYEGYPVTGIVDFENKTITLNKAQIYTHSTYGPTFMSDYPATNPFTNPIATATYQKNGNTVTITFKSWMAWVEAGSLARLSTIMTK